MDVYPAVVFVHAATILLFFIAHGTSMAVAFKLKRETDPSRVRALLELSRFAMGIPAIAFVLIGLISGIVAGFLGDWWGTAWIWISIALFVVVGGLMTPLATTRLGRIGAAAGMPQGKGADVTVSEDPEAMRRLIAAWNPLPVAAMGLTTFLVILWLMMAKPF
ncbi:MAG: DUF2269 domain-containing protein [Chloroflexi bacterium]|nr:DUF2269 domain-containing protein [Chloroflexota bacterium]